MLVSLVSNELAQSLKRIIAFWTNMRSFWCQIFVLRRTSQTTRWWYFDRSVCRTNAIHIQDAKILPEPTVQNHCPTAPPPRSRKTAPRVLPLSSKMVSDSKRSFSKEGKQDVLVGRRILHKVLVPLKATSVQFRGRWYQAKEIPNLSSVDCAFFCAIFRFRSNCRLSSHHLATSAWKKRRRKRNGMPARNHTGRNLVQARRAPSFKFMSDAAHNVEVRTKVPSHRSCRAKKHALAVKGSHILSGTLTRKEDGVFLLRHVFPAHCPGQHCSPSLLTMCEPVPW